MNENFVHLKEIVEFDKIELVIVVILFVKLFKINKYFKTIFPVSFEGIYPIQNIIIKVAITGRTITEHYIKYKLIFYMGNLLSRLIFYPFNSHKF